MTQKKHPVDNKSSQKNVIIVKCFPDTPYPLDDCDFAVIEVTDDVKREGRAYSNLADYTFRAAIDTLGNQYMMLRGVFEHTKRIGDGLSLERIEEAG